MRMILQGGGLVSGSGGRCRGTQRKTVAGAVSAAQQSDLRLTAAGV
jgi:hypothetical protein